LIAVARGLAIGAAGGTVCWLAGFPAPWLAGSMAAAVAAVFGGVRIGMPDWLKSLSFIFLGIQTGTTVTWDTVDRAADWPFSIAFLGLTVVAVTWACMQFYTRWRGWDGATALFASLPGALSLVLVLASETAADMRRVTISQCIRLFFLVAALPVVISIISPRQAVPPVTAAPIDGLFDIVLVVGASTLAGLGLERLRVPAGLLVGSMLVSGGLELSGVIRGAAPASLLIPANIVLGVMIAARFTHFSFTEFRQALGEGFSGFVIALAIATAGALLTSVVTGFPLALTLLAFAPGGLDAMTIMAFALDLDPAYVGAHQIARFVGMALLMPAVTALLVQRFGAEPRMPAARSGLQPDED